VLQGLGHQQVALQGKAANGFAQRHLVVPFADDLQGGVEQRALRVVLLEDDEFFRVGVDDVAEGQLQQEGAGEADLQRLARQGVELAGLGIQRENDKLLSKGHVGQ